MKSIVSILGAVIGITLVLFLSTNEMSGGKINREQRVEYRTIIHDSHSFRSHDPWTFVIQNKHEEEGFLAKTGSVTDFAGVDYSKQMVICLLGGWRPSVDISITIDSILQKDTRIIVYSHESHPTAQNMVSGYPAHIVVLQKLAPVEFEATRIITVR